jgi:hypothetical protein
LVEQLTFNQWVAGSNPARLTTDLQKMKTKPSIRLAAESADFVVEALQGGFSRLPNCE